MAADFTDELTGALSRTGLAAWLEALQDERDAIGRDFAVAMLDLDHLKTINDVYGHAAGDAVIRTVAQRAISGLRAGDRLIRYGGDEFLVLLPGTAHSEAASILERVRTHVIGDPIDAGERLRVTVSIGLASSSENPAWEVGDTLLEADRRLYNAKRRGRNALVADDGEPSPTDSRPFASTRLYGRDAELAAIDDFLGLAAEDASQRVLQVTGDEGAGLTRFLGEAGIRAGLTGQTVRHVTADEAHRQLHLRALQLAYAAELSADTPAALLRERLQHEAREAGLVILLEGGQHLDPASHKLLAECLRTGHARLIECVGQDSTPAFPTATIIRLGPLGPEDVRNWLSAATAGPLEPETALLLHRAGAGLPGKIATLTEFLLQENALTLTPGGLSAGAETIRAAAVALEHHNSRTAVNLPTWPTPLVGRNQLIEQLRPTLLQKRFLVLTGEGGTGKSRLAAQLARELSSELSLDTTWLSLRAISSTGQLPRMLADSLGLEPHDELPPVIEQLRGRKHLLVLDGADALASSTGLLEELISELPGLRLLVTARQPLRATGETIINVPLLDPASARELFEQAAARHGAAEAAGNGPVAELLELVGYAPLNIELAAAWSRVFSPAELLRELTENPGLLAEAPGLRPETVRFIDVTRQLMSPPEQETLGTLALIPGTFNAELALKAAGASAFFLLALLERALLHREGSRYTVHAAIAERFRAGLANPTAARSAIAQAWTSLASDIEDMDNYARSTRGYRIIDEEEANFRFAIAETLKNPDPAQLWPLVRIMRGYLDVRGRRRDGLELFQAIDRAITGSPDGELRGWVRECVALFLMQHRRLDEAAATISEAIALTERYAPGSESLGLAWNTAGIIRAMSGDDEAGLEAFNHSAHIRAQLEDETGELQARINAVMILADIKEPAESLVQLDTLIERCRRAGQVTGSCLMLIRKATLLREAAIGSTDERLHCLREALANVESSGYPQAGQAACRELGETMLELGKPLEAADAFEQAARWAEAENREEARLELLARAAELRRRSGTRSGVPQQTSAGQQL